MIGGIQMQLKMFLFLLTIATIAHAQTTDESWKLYDDSEVATITISIDPENLEWIYNNVQSDSLHITSIHFKNKWIDETVDSVGFRLRGNTSRDAQKKSFKISFNSFISGRKFYNVEKLNLNGEHNDPSIIRSKLAWDLYENIGMNTTRASHIAVYINDEYYGLYISIEHIDEEFLQKNFADDSGNLFRCLWPADLTYRGANPADYFPYSGDEKPYELKTNTDNYDYSKLAELISKINLTSSQNLADSLEKILVIPEFLKYLAMNILIGSWDDYWSLMNNYYIYFDPKIEKFRWIPFDYDNSFGIDWFNVDWANANPYSFPKVDDGNRPLAEKLMVNAQYRNLYTHFLEFLDSEVVSDPNFDRKMDTLHNLITPYAQDDYYRTLDYQFTSNDFHRSYTSIEFEKDHVKRGIKEFIRVRSSSLPSMLSYQDAEPLIYYFDYEPKYPAAEDTIYVQVSAFGYLGIENINILYHPEDLTVVNSYPMTFSPVKGTKKIEETDFWIGKIPPLGKNGFGKFQIVATDVSSTSGSYPRNEYIYISSPSITNNEIKINELLAQNDSTNSDQDGEFDDWIEIVNSTNEVISLEGLFLTDDHENLEKWQFPDGAIIQPEQFLLVWCDNDENQGGLHTNFKLSASGEFIGIIDRDGNSIIDSITFPEQASDIAYGRYPDSSNDWIFMDPTPSSKNGNSVDVKQQNNISKFELLQNYPNPFNPTTTIEYYIPDKSFVRINVFNVLGEEVVTLVSKIQETGKYSITFDATHLPSGVYFYKIKAGNYTDVKKLLLIR